MRLLILTFSIFLYSHFLQAQDGIIINGTAKGKACDTVRLQYPSLKGEEKVYSVLKDSAFAFTIPKKTSEAIFSCGNKKIYLFLETGNAVSIKIKQDGGAEFSGSGHINNMALQAFMEEFKKQYDIRYWKSKITESTPDAIEIDLYENAKKQKEFFAKYGGKEQLSEAFNKYIETLIRYYYYGNLISYPFVNAGTRALEIKRLPAGMLDKIDKNKISNDEQLSCTLYMSFLNNYISYLAFEENNFKFPDASTFLDKKLFLAKQFLKGESLFSVYISSILEWCEKASPSVLKKHMAVLSEMDKSGEYVKLVDSKCGKWINAREEKKPKSKPLVAQTGNDPVPKLKFKSANGKAISLSDLKGKVLYVDFWASWCGPCRQQFPYSKEMESKLSDKQKKQIEFVYISIDATEADWKKGIEQNKLKGMQLWSPGNWDSEATKYFNINSIPRYMIIDKNGNVINKNAPRPSEPATLEILLDLLK